MKDCADDGTDSGVTAMTAAAAAATVDDVGVVAALLQQMGWQSNGSVLVGDN